MTEIRNGKDPLGIIILLLVKAFSVCVFEHSLV